VNMDTAKTTGTSVGENSTGGWEGEVETIVEREAS
jgi:hypothetical protein